MATIRTPDIKIEPLDAALDEARELIAESDAFYLDLYPPESNLVDEKDHYHLWGFRRAGESFGVGFRGGRQVREGG